MTARFQSLIADLVTEIGRDYRQAQDYARRKDAQRAGHEGESTWKRLLQDWGPDWPVVTRKYIVGPGGESNEVDLLILKPNYPKGLQEEAAVLVSGVAAAFSSKLTLRRHHLREAISQKRRLLDIAGETRGTVEAALAGPFPFGLLAHSSALGNRTDLAEHLQELYSEIAHEHEDPIVRSPREELDALLVADSAFLSTRRMSLAPVPQASSGMWQPSSSFVRHAAAGLDGAPLAQFLTWLHSKCAGASPSPLQSLELEFGAHSASGYLTSWSRDIYPDHVNQDARRHLLNEHGNPLTF